MKNNEKSIIIVNFQELATDLQYTQTTFCKKINDVGIPRHLNINHLNKLNLIDLIDLPVDFGCLGVIPSVNVKDDVRIVKPTLFNFNGEIWLFDSKITPFKKVEKINSWLIGVGSYANINIDNIEMIVNISGDKEVLENKGVFSMSSKTVGELLPELLTTPLVIVTPLKSRMFEIGKVYEVINNQNIRAKYHEKENDVDVETGLLIDVKIDEKTIIKNVICNSQLERLLTTNTIPFKFKIADKKEISKGKIKVIITNPNTKEVNVKLEDFDFI